MEGAFDAIAHDTWPFTGLLADSITQVSAHVRAEGVDNFCLASFRSENNEFLPEVFDRNRITYG